MVLFLFVISRYEHNETYESKFGDLAEIFTNCRAELCSLYFVYFKEIHKIFELEESFYDNIIYTIWLLFIREALLSLKHYNKEKKEWRLPSQSYLWMILNFLLKNATNEQDIMNLHVNEEKRSYKISVNRYSLNLILKVQQFCATDKKCFQKC